jgi:DNA-binding beta-propeller fold protein YncE
LDRIKGYEMTGRGEARFAATWGRRLSSAVMLALVLALALVVAGSARAAVGDLTFEGCVGTAGGCTSVTNGLMDAPDAVAVSPNGRSVYVASQPGIKPTLPGGTPGALVHLVAGADGHLSYDSCISEGGTNGACSNVDNDSLYDIDGVAVSPNGGSVYTSAAGYEDDGGGLGHAFANPTTGALTWDGCVSDKGTDGHCADATGTRTLAGPDSVTLSPNGGSIYARADPPGGGGIAHLFANSAQGQLTWDGCISNDGDLGACADIPGTGMAINQPSGIAVSPDGGSVYEAGNGEVSHFFAAPGQGQLTWDGCVSDDGSQGACAKISGTGVPLQQTGPIVVSPDGRSVYSAGLRGISRFSANPATGGQITWQGCVSADGSDGACSTAPQSASAILDPNGLAISPDGRTLYVTSGESAAVSWFSLGGDGTMTFQGCMSDDGITGCTNPPGDPLEGADAIAVSADGTSLYVASGGANAVVHLVRETATGGGGGGGTGGGGTGGGGTGGGGSSGTRHAKSATIAGHQVTLTGSWPAGCVAHGGSVKAGLSAASGGSAKATFASAGLFLDRGVRHVHRHKVRRHGHQVVVKKTTYKPQRTVHSLPATATLHLAKLKPGSHKLRALVTYRQKTRSHHRVRTRRVSKTLALRFTICAS